MDTLNSLKKALREAASDDGSPSRQPLSDAEYEKGFKTFVEGRGWLNYRDFIIPQLSRLLVSLFASRLYISVLEIGPGPHSVLAHLPAPMRQKVAKYTAFEPTGLFAAKLDTSVSTVFPSLQTPSRILQMPFGLTDNTSDNKITYDVILFCHSLYGMKPQHKYIKRAMEMLAEQGSPASPGIVVVFHREGTLDLDTLCAHQSALFHEGDVSVPDNDGALDCFAAFVAGFTLDPDGDNAVKLNWRKLCRILGRRTEKPSNDLLFSAPEVMVAFTKHATATSELPSQIIIGRDSLTVKNREARAHQPAAVVRPTEIAQVQHCVRWALKHRVRLTVVGGGHSGHCLRPHTVAVDMAAFNQVHFLTAAEAESQCGTPSGPLVVVGAGCKAGDIVRQTQAVGLTVPLGARPSVGAGLWLQGGIGHLARQHGLACDAVVGAVIVSVDSSQVLCLGRVPVKHQPANAVRPVNEADLLWALKGAGTNFGIVKSITFQAYRAPNYVVRNWVLPLTDSNHAQLVILQFDMFSRELQRHCSADAYLHWDAGQLQLGVTVYESFVERPPTATVQCPMTWGPEHECKTVDGIGMFETEIYMARMHGGHGGGKTSSFKRCIFLNQIGEEAVVTRLIKAIQRRPSPLCYLHLLQGGAAVRDVAPDATAFGCRDWDFACVITAVWPRNQDNTTLAKVATQWVYDVVKDLLPIASGVYGADLGPDSRDLSLATMAFGPNRSRLARLKQRADPHRVLPYACPLPEPLMPPKMIVLVTGKNGAGKDYCASIWAAVFTHDASGNPTARAVSISDATKREYAAATGADLDRLLQDRGYKEKHRPALTAFYREQVRQNCKLPRQHFLDVVYANADVDVLLITGMRDDAPVTALSPLVPAYRVIEVHVEANSLIRSVRRGRGSDGIPGEQIEDRESDSDRPVPAHYRPTFVFRNDASDEEASKQFARSHLLPFCHENLQQLALMVRSVADFPRSGIEFRHVLGIAQQPGGLALCTSLLRTYFAGDWNKVDAIVCCEAGGFIFASALASCVKVPLVLIREAGKLPPPTLSVIKSQSYISSAQVRCSELKRITMEKDVLPPAASVVVVDDVLATGETMCAILRLLDEAQVENATTMVIAEFPIHRGRETLLRHGLGKFPVQSLLVFDGM